MRYYLYVSDAKLDMLWAQVPAKLRDVIAAELKIDLKVVGVTFNEAASTRDARYQQLELVREYLLKNVPVGSLEAPATWLTGTLPMRWASVTGAGSGDVVYFGGSVLGMTIGLVGSRRHLVGYRGEGTVGIDTGGAGSSMAADMIQRLERTLAGAMAREDDSLTPADPTAQVAVDMAANRAHDPDQLALHTVQSTTDSLQGPLQRVEFLAKRLLQGSLIIATHDGLTEYQPVLLATPLYVALAD